jgi:hypothetical protein
MKKCETLRAMKTINRIALGTISSLLLSAGMVQAAQRLDPLSNSIVESGESPTGRQNASAQGCAPCAYQLD